MTFGFDFGREPDGPVEELYRQHCFHIYEHANLLINMDFSVWYENC